MKIAKSFNKAANTYNEFAILQREVADRLFDRLQFFNLDPKLVLDLGCSTGYCTTKLSLHFQQAQVFGVDIAEDMLSLAAQNNSVIHADAASLPFENNSVDLIFSNLMLQWCDDLPKAFNEIQRVLKPKGLFLFTTMGSDTLFELKRAWQTVDNDSHVNDFVDMHDVGDVLMQHNFLDPVMDSEVITLTYKTIQSLMQDLKGIGANHVNNRQAKGLIGKNAFAQMQQAYQQYQLEDQTYPASYEVVYGHAFGGMTSSKDTLSPVQIPVVAKPQ